MGKYFNEKLKGTNFPTNVKPKIGTDPRERYKNVIAQGGTLGQTAYLMQDTTLGIPPRPEPAIDTNSSTKPDIGRRRRVGRPRKGESRKKVRRMRVTAGEKGNNA